MDTQVQLTLACVKVMINVCSLHCSRVYIPGETHTADQLSKRSYDCGSYALLVTVSALVSQNPEPYQQVKQALETKFFNMLEMSDLEYNLKLIKMARDQKLPPLVAEEEIENKLY